MRSIISVKGLKKYFEGHVALKGIDFQIQEGITLGLLGPNGAGKTTLIRHLTQIYLPDEGEIYYKNEVLSPKHISQIGYMPEEKGMYKKMKVGEHLIYLARLRGLSKQQAKQKVEFWLHHFQITAWWEKKLEDLSKGMQQKVQFIATVLHDPEFLILDEPFSGLDPINAQLIKDEIIRLKNLGTTIIFSTHRMESVEEMCQEIALINHGEIILQGKISDVKHQFKRHEFKVQFDVSTPFPEELFIQYNARMMEDGHAIIRLPQGSKPSVFLKEALAQNMEITALAEIFPSIGDIFIEQVKNHSHE